MKTLVKLAGGSHAYGLETPQSDYDERYVFMHDDIANIVGLGKNEFVDKRNDTEDSFGFELRHFISSLRKTNTQVMEILFMDEEKYIEVHPMFLSEIKENRFRLVDPERYYTSLRGYIQNERRLANGERIGKLGFKRREAIDKYGFSPKNFVQLLRLAECGKAFFRGCEFPVNIKNWDEALWTKLMDIKTDPGKFTKEQLNDDVNLADNELELAFYAAKERGLENISHYNDELANDILFKFYYPMLGKLNAQRLAI